MSVSFRTSKSMATLCVLAGGGRRIFTANIIIFSQFLNILPSSAVQ